MDEGIQSIQVAVVAVVIVTAAQASPLGWWVISGEYVHPALYAVSALYLYVSGKADNKKNVTWGRVVLGLFGYLIALWIAGGIAITIATSFRL